MISVKKPDGTTVRVPLSEFKKMHAAPAANAPADAAPAPVTEPPKPSVLPPVKLDPHTEIEAARETPLLEESIAPAEVRSTEIMQAPPAINDEVVRQIVRESKLMVANDLWGRAQSLIASWLKGVRDNDQFLHYATASADKGGLGLETEVAAGLIVVMAKFKRNQSASPTPERPTAKPALEVPLSAPATKAFTQSLGESSAPKPLRLNTPVNPKIEPAPVAPVEPSIQAAPVVPVAPVVPMAPVSPKVIQDIRVAATPLTGPAEEMQSFTITDWRRLGAQTEAAAAAFLAKFSGWRQESFLLYMDAATAWQQSPLLQQYLEIAVRSVNQKRPVADVAAELGTMSAAEWVAINAVNREVML